MPVTKLDMERKARTQSVENAVNRYEAVQGGTKRYRQRLEEFRDMGLSLAPERGCTPTPETVKKMLEVVKKIAKGGNELEILDWIQDTYGYGFAMAKKYYTAALNFLVPAEPEETRQQSIAVLEARYEELYKKAYDNGQYKTARDILDSLAKLKGYTGGNSVRIAENERGDRLIEVKFD